MLIKVAAVSFSVFCCFSLVFTSRIFSKWEFISYFISILIVYALFIFRAYKNGELKTIFRTAKRTVVITSILFIFLASPLLVAKIAGIVSSGIDLPVLVAFNFCFTLLLVASYYSLLNFNALAGRIFLHIALNSILVLNSLFVGLLYFTGFDFSFTLLLHLDKEAVFLVFDEYWRIFAVIFIGAASSSFWLVQKIFAGPDRGSKIDVVSLGMLAISTNAMAINHNAQEVIGAVPSIAILETLVDGQSSAKELNVFLDSISYDLEELSALEEIGFSQPRSPITRADAIDTPNLILVYLESFQSNFTRQGGWPEAKSLTPNLDNLRDKFAIFPEFYSTATPTINAMLTSLCGVEIELDERSNLVLSEDHRMLNVYSYGLKCLPDYLKEAGYSQTFMKGASLDFSNKRRLLENHGYDNLLDRDRINFFGQYSDDLNSWGIPDPILFRHAIDEIERLNSLESPYNLTVLTVNSHFPGYENRECPTYQEGNTLLNGIHCTDYSFGWFFEQLERKHLLDNTVLVVLGDHVMFAAPSVDHQLSMLKKTSWYGKAYLGVYAPGIDLPKTVATRGLTQDLAPTVLQLLGFDGASFISGHSMLGSREGHQYLITKSYEVKDGSMRPERVSDKVARCTVQELNEAKISLSSSGLSQCQREKIYYFGLKKIFELPRVDG